LTFYAIKKYNFNTFEFRVFPDHSHLLLETQAYQIKREEFGNSSLVLATIF
jgi:REP element-mobilizing transposase RayT